MIRTLLKQLLSTTLSFLLVMNALPFEAEGQQPEAAAPPGNPEQGAPLSADELQQLTAPIALYPDALVAQILGAATFPDQIAAANNFLQVNKNLTESALMQAVNNESWDPSVKALTQFPSVLDNLAKNLSWASALGEAYHSQAADVMSAIQALRAKAYAAGNLKSGSQITVVQESPQVIVIQPTNPQVVYVPQYNPTVVYGTPYTTPGYSTAAVVTTGLLAFGAGIAIGAAMSNSCCGWGYSYWNCNWHGGAVVYRNNVYYGNNAWHGGYYGTARVSSGYNPATGTYARGGTVSTPYGSRSAGQAYNPSTGTYARGASASGPYGSTAAGQAYNPRTGAYAATHQTSNAYGSYGSSVASKNGNTAYTQHQTTAQGSVGTVQTSAGGRGAAATGANGSAAAGQTANGNRYAAGQTANGNKYAAQNGNVYKNTGSGWQQTQPQRSTSSYSGANSTAARGYGGQEKSSGSSAFGGGGSGWQSRQASARGSTSRSGGWGGRR
jgi:hypothetical protein